MDRYWVGNSGNWNDSSHWSTTSGGVGGSSIPASTDNVYFDENSFTSSGQIITLNVVANCNNMDWTKVLNNPTFSNSNNAISIYGNLSLSSNMSITGNTSFIAGGFYLRGIGTINTFEIPITFRIYFAPDANYTLLSNINTSNVITSTNPMTFNTNNHNIICNMFTIKNVNCILNLGTSIITATSNAIGFTIYPDLSSQPDVKFIASGTSPVIQGYYLTGGYIPSLEIVNGANFTVTDQPLTINKLILHSGSVIQVSEGKNLIINSLEGNGTIDKLTKIQSTVSGSPFTLFCPSGNISVNYCIIKDCIATGGATFNAINSVNAGGNSSWVFSPEMLVIGNMYFNTPSGKVDIPIYHIDTDFPNKALRVSTPNGIGFIELVDPDDIKDSKIRVQTINAVKALARAA